MHLGPVARPPRLDTVRDICCLRGPAKGRPTDTAPHHPLLRRRDGHHAASDLRGSDRSVWHLRDHPNHYELLHTLPAPRGRRRNADPLWFAGVKALAGLVRLLDHSWFRSRDAAHPWHALRRDAGGLIMASSVPVPSANSGLVFCARLCRDRNRAHRLSSPGNWGAIIRWRDSASGSSAGSASRRCSGSPGLWWDAAFWALAVAANMSRR